MPERTRLAREALARAQTVVIKIGTNVLAAHDGTIDTAVVGQLARQAAELVRHRRRVLLVSSGAVAAGLERLKLRARPTEMPEIQACAAVGQARLMAHWEHAFAPLGLPTAQLLLTREDFDDRGRFLNIRRTLDAIHALGAVAIINENDTISTEEIKFGDNDVLASLLAHMLRADACLFLTTAPGLLDQAGQLVEVVHDVGSVLGLARSSRSKLGSGGMKSKLQWAAAVSHAGDVAVIANGREPGIITRLLAGEPLGTLLIPARGLGGAGKLSSRERWIGLAARPAGVVVVDAGAAAALRRGTSSLLPVGVRKVEGRFEAGEVVAVADESGAEHARGLIAYDSTIARQLAGLHKDQVLKLLGPSAKQELIHRDNLVLTPAASADA